MTTRTPRTLLSAAAVLLLTACGAGGTPAAPAHGPGSTHAEAVTAGAPTPRPATLPRQVPGLGPKTLAEVPPRSRQVVVVTGRGRDSSKSEVVVHRRTATGWKAGRSWPAHNALKGWTDHHVLGDLRSPVGVFTLTDAGGLLPDPGTKLPYDRSAAFTATGSGFEGEPLAGSFDYVVAIDYNREPGTSPLDRTRPLGEDRGGGVWFHVDHGGPTQACVGLRKEHMRELLLTLDPDLRPVVAMGDAGSLAR
jgi:L,D-peptidoglycan transpeptidase YkuD (ErfK/YbiS/YcfS/YnhG family)